LPHKLGSSHSVEFKLNLNLHTYDDDDDDDIYLLQLVFHPMALFGKLLQNYERDRCVQKEKQHTN
jgi:hypothetical protein